MFLRQVHDPHLAQYAYVIGCQRTGEAIVIDPLRDVAQYRAIAAAEGMTLSAVAETHIHADFVSGARELASDGKTSVLVSAEGGPTWQSEWTEGLPNARRLHHGDVFHIGHIRLQALHTPGHTPEHLCYLVTDEGGGADEPIALVSGDFLFVGDVGRPDLLEQAAGFSGTQEAGASQLYHSLKTLRDLPDHLQILPAHGAGSACGKSLGAVPTSTLGYERKFNHALKLALHGSEAAFVRFILDGQPEPPLYFANMKRVNQLGPALLGEPSSLPRRDLEPVAARLSETDFVVLDARSDRRAFASGHLRGSLYAPAKGDFSGFAGSYLAPGDRILLVVDAAEEVDDLARQLHRIGFDHTEGWLPASAIVEADETILDRIRPIAFDGLEALLDSAPEARILDVRRAGEYAAGHLRGSMNIAHTRLRGRSHELPKDAPVIVHCQSGNRASAAMAWLRREGRETIYVDDAFANAPAALLA